MLESAVSSYSPTMETLNEKKLIKHTITTEDGMMQVENMRLFLYVDEAGLEDIIVNQRIKLSCAWRTNDATEAVAQNETQRSDKVNEVGYICLSALCDSPAMWGYYANRSTGACLVFDFPVRQRNCGHQYQILRHGLTHNSFSQYWIQKIRYTDIRAKAIKDDEENFDLLTTKSIDWQHEREYRIFYNLLQLDLNDVEIIKRPGKIGVVYYVCEILENLSGIILGVNSSMTPQEVLSLIKRVPIEHKKNPEIHSKAYMQINDIKVIKAKFHSTNFAYDISIEHIPTRNEFFYSDRFHELFNAQWVEVNMFGMDMDFHSEINIEHCYACSTNIQRGDESLRFFIAKGTANGENKNEQYALFLQRGNDYMHYQYAYKVYPEILKKIYESAVQSDKKGAEGIRIICNTVP